MLTRREWLRLALTSGATVCTFGIVGCGKDELQKISRGAVSIVRGEVILYDTYAMALYMDGGLGPKTGIIKVDYVLANQPLTLDFWHGHGGILHRYTVTPEHFSQLKKLKQVTLETTEVEDHTHKLFIDPNDPKWRVPGAQPVHVPIP